MNSASAVRVTKIKVKKDKLGVKQATIELTRVVEPEDQFIAGVKLAVEQMGENEALESVKLSETAKSKNLIFWAAVGIDKPSEQFHCVTLGRFRIKREVMDESKSRLVLSFEFTVSLEDARVWIIPSIGDDVLCVVEDAQLSFSAGME